MSKKKIEEAAENAFEHLQQLAPDGTVQRELQALRRSFTDLRKLESAKAAEVETLAASNQAHKDKQERQRNELAAAQKQADYLAARGTSLLNAAQ